MTWDIEAAKKRCEEATPGPWWMQGRLYEDETGIAGGVYPDVGFEIDEEGGTTAIIQDGISESDADFIAHARTDLPAAIARIEWLEKMLERAKAIIETCGCGMVEDDGAFIIADRTHWLDDLEGGPPE